MTDHISTYIGFNEPSLARNFLFKRLQNDGSYDMNIDASTVSKEFIYKSPIDKDSFITRINFIIGYDKIKKPTSHTFADLDQSLHNGILVEVLNCDNIMVLDVLDNTTIKENIDFALMCGIDFSINTFFNTMIISWSLISNGGLLLLEENETIRITIRDDLSSLVKFQAIVQGTIFNN